MDTELPIDLRAIDEGHVQQPAPFAQKGSYPENAYPIVIHAPTRQKVLYLGAARLPDVFAIKSTHD